MENKKNKYVLHFMGMESSKYGGIERFNVKLSSELYNKGYNSIFIYEKEPVVNQFNEDLKNGHAEVVVLSSKNVFTFIYGLIKLLLFYKPDVIHAHFTKARFYVVPIAYILGIKNIVYTLHSRMPNIDDIKFHTRFWYNICNKFSRIVAVSKQIEIQVRKNWPLSTVNNIYMGIDCSSQMSKYTARTELGMNHNKLILLTIANYNHIKGLDILCNSIKELVKRGEMENKLVYIVGQEEKDIKELTNLIEDLGISDYIIMEGIRNDVYKYMISADIYLQTSRSEGLPLAIMEATASGLPIIASNVGGIPEIAINNRNALLFESSDIEDLSAKIRELSNNFDLIADFGIQSKKIYEDNFTLNKNVLKLIRYYFNK